MKKLLAILTLALFIGGLSAPVFAAQNTNTIAISLADKDPKKAKKEKSEKSECKGEKTKSDCKTDCEKSCEKSCEGDASK